MGKKATAYNTQKMTEGFGREEQTGTSIFDPVLCELLYSWFCPPGGTVLDPFAGGSVRGIVAAKTGRHYVGVDLRPEQIEANREQAKAILGEEAAPEWHHGDSMKIDQICKGTEADMIISCPPYANLEVYSDLPEDISTMPYDQFIVNYREIIKKTCAMLKEDSFAAWVVGEVRAKDGTYYGLIPDTIQAFRDAGLKYYNEMILLTSVASLAVRVSKQFNASRKIGKTHQNVLIFLKGDGKKAAQNMGEIEINISDGLEGCEVL